MILCQAASFKGCAYDPEALIRSEFVVANIIASVVLQSMLVSFHGHHLHRMMLPDCLICARQQHLFAFATTTSDKFKYIGLSFGSDIRSMLPSDCCRKK